MAWKRLPFYIDHRKPDYDIQQPETHGLMTDLARKLSAEWPFVRVDFLGTAVPKLGEMTFYPTSGFCPFVPDEADFHLGERLTLPEAYVPNG